MPFYRLRVVVLPLSWLVLTLEGRNRGNDKHSGTFCCYVPYFRKRNAVISREYGIRFSCTQ